MHIHFSPVNQQRLEITDPTSGQSTLVREAEDREANNSRVSEGASGNEAPVLIEFDVIENELQQIADSGNTGNRSEILSDSGQTSDVKVLNALDAYNIEQDQPLRDRQDDLSDLLGIDYFI